MMITQTFHIKVENGYGKMDVSINDDGDGMPHMNIHRNSGQVDLQLTFEEADELLDCMQRLIKQAQEQNQWYEKQKQQAQLDKEEVFARR